MQPERPQTEKEPIERPGKHNWQTPRVIVGEIDEDTEDDRGIIGRPIPFS
jgi:hypothetical protein